VSVAVQETGRFIGPDGTVLVLDGKVFEALQSMFRNKHTGSIVLDYRDGGVAGVKKTIVCK
jgi:hypothetical protein